MKILYGVQGTGNGHVTRARALNKHFRRFGLEVDFLFSGRERRKYFDMEEFGQNWQCLQGLTFSYSGGRIKILGTLFGNRINTFLEEIRSLDLAAYDLVITDFEPVSAWAARRQKKPCIGIGHQYAFRYTVPKSGNNMVSKLLMRFFAPANYRLGLHWHHFNAPILPPIAEIHPEVRQIDRDKIVVYLGFEEIEDIVQFVEPFQSWLFVVYGPFTDYESFGNIQLKPLSREGFCRDLETCNGVISNAGFELASEAIQLGKKLLVKPLMGQMEQMSNAKALELLGLGMTMETLDRNTLREWLNGFEPQQMVYPDVAEAIVEWISKKEWSKPEQLAQALWDRVTIPATKRQTTPALTPTSKNAVRLERA
jgi:uncharacterized protein (TIGR00661 family)